MFLGFGNSLLHCEITGHVFDKRFNYIAPVKVCLYLRFFIRIAPKPFFRQLAQSTLLPFFIQSKKVTFLELDCSHIPSSIKKTEPLLFQIAENSTPTYKFKDLSRGGGGSD